MEQPMNAKEDAGGQSRLTAGLGAWLPIATVPQDGYMLVHEDGAIRALMRIKGTWHKCGYPALVEPTWGDVLVGDDARRMLPPGYRLELRDGCCDNPTHWMPLPEAPNVEVSSRADHFTTENPAVVRSAAP